MININGDDDPFYRYKMKRLITKIDGSGNGLKIVLTNIKHISKNINRDVSHLTKYISIESNSKLLVKNDRYILQGKHDEKQLQNTTYNFY